MIDEIFDRSYRQARSPLNSSLFDGIAAIGRKLNDSFEVLHRIEWSAPWESKSRKVQCH